MRRVEPHPGDSLPLEPRASSLPAELSTGMYTRCHERWEVYPGWYRGGTYPDGTRVVHTRVGIEGSTYPGGHIGRYISNPE